MSLELRIQELTAALALNTASNDALVKALASGGSVAVSASTAAVVKADPKTTPQPDAAKKAAEAAAAKKLKADADAAAKAKADAEALAAAEAAKEDDLGLDPLEETVEEVLTLEQIKVYANGFVQDNTPLIRKAFAALNPPAKNFKDVTDANGMEFFTALKKLVEAAGAKPTVKAA